MSATKPLILIDGSSWLFRAFHALPPLTNPQGEATGAVFGMTTMLKRLLKEYAPERIAVIFDPPGPTFRNELYAEYKANRDETPDELKKQFPIVSDLIKALGLPVLQVPGFEADDVIGTLAIQGREQGLTVLIITGDKDMAQLVDGQVRLLDTMKNRTLDAAAVKEKFGVPPERIIDYLALMGDSSDNIPGVPGVGEKTAAKLLNEYGSLDALVARAGEVKGKLGDNLRAALADLSLWRQLTTIRCDLTLKETVDDLRPGEADKEKLAALYKRMGFNRWLEELKNETPEPSHPRAGGDPASSVETTAPLDSRLRGNDEVVVLPPSAKTRAETVLDEAAFAAMLKKLKAAPLICLDTETDSLDSQQARIVGLSFAVEAGHGWYVPLAHSYLGVPQQLEMKSVLARLKPILEDAKNPKLGQHIKYDLNVLHHHGIDVAGVDYDTMLESFVVDAGSNRHDMDTLALKYLNHSTIHYEDVTGKGKSQIPFHQVAIDKAADYSAEDADITLRLHQTLHPRVIAEPGLKRVFETIEMPLVPALAQIERNGVRIDAGLLGRISLEFAKRMDEYQLLCWKEAGQEFNLGSPLQLQQILYEKLKLPVLGHTPKGQPSTAEDVLAELAEQHPLPKLILSWRELSKLRSTYTETLPLQINPNTGRVHTSYHQAGAATGRLSSSDPNLQNIPVRTEEGRRIRQAFIASEGNLLLSIDYSQIELRLMAHLSNDPRLQEAFKKGLDIHQATAAEVLGLSLEQVTSEQRRSAKAVNFGLIYGMSAFGLAKQLGIARGEAGDYMAKFFERYAGVKTFMDETKEKARAQGYVETLFGRRLYLPNIKSKNQAQRGYAERTAINAPLQGTAADLIKLAMIDLHAFLQKEKSPVRMIMQVHDELVFEGPQKIVTELAPLLAERMCLVARLNVPLVADWGIGTEWNQAHSPQGHASH